MRSAILAFFFGVVFILWLSRLPNTLELLAVLFFIFVSGFALFISDNKFLKLFLRLIIIFCMGFLWAVLNSYLVISHRIPESLFDENLWVVGEISSLPKHSLYQDSFLFRIQKIEGHPNIAKNSIIQLNDYNKNNLLKVGDVWKFHIKLRAIHGLANPGGFDSEKLFFEHRIQASGTVQKNAANRLLYSSLLHQPINRIRQAIKNLLDAQLNHLPLAGIITAIVMGDTSGITNEQWEVFRRTGTNHLVAISGLHIALVGGGLYTLGHWLWRRIPSFCLRWPAPHAAFIQGLIAGIVYSSLAGFSVSTQRAVIMIMVMMGFGLLERNVLAWYNFLMALLFVLLLDPLAVLSTSFWLSFSAVAIIFYGMGARLDKKKNLWWKFGRAQWVITICMLPLSVLIFQQVALASFAANWVAIPWVEFIVVPLSLGGTLLALIHEKTGAWLFILAEQALHCIWPFLSYLSSLDDLVWPFIFYKPWIFLFTLIGILLLMAPRGLPGRCLGFFFLLPLFFNISEKPKSGEVWFTLLDVGQGLSAVLQTQHHVLVFDTGLKLSDAILRAQGIHHIHKLIISHGDKDHAGGAEDLVRQMKVDELFTSVPEKFNSEKFSGVSVQHCYAGQAWQWDGIDFQFLNPPTPDSVMMYSNKIENNNSCVLRVSVGKRHILIPGNIEKPAERYLIEHFGEALPADILVAPHHGSRSSSSALFVYSVNPQYVLFPIGYHNRYHFPHPWVVQRYREMGAVMLNTAEEGAITFKLSSKQEGMDTPISYRRTHQHFWNG